MYFRILLVAIFTFGGFLGASGQKLITDFNGGNSFRFDGETVLGRAVSDFPSGNNDRTLAILFRIDEFRSEEVFLGGYGNFGSFGSSYHLGTSNRRLFFSQWGGAVFGPELKSGVWYEAVVNNRSDSVSLFLNGCLVSSAELPIQTPAKSDFYMGRLPGEIGNIRQLVGDLGSVRIYEGAWEPSEIGFRFDELVRSAPCASTLANR